MTAPDQGSFVFNEVMLDGDQQVFWWEPGTRVDCTLLPQQDGIFEGICTDGSGSDGEGTLRMVPPSGEDGVPQAWPQDAGDPQR